MYRKDAPRKSLLSLVGGKSTASSSPRPQAAPVPTPKTDDVDTDADPLSSDDEQQSSSPPPAQTLPSPPKARQPVYPEKQQRMRPIEKVRQVENEVNPTAEGSPKTSSQSSLGKRSPSTKTEDDNIFEDDMGPTKPRKMPKRSYGKSAVGNTHAKPARKGAGAGGKKADKAAFKDPPKADTKAPISKGRAFVTPEDVPFGPKAGANPQRSIAKHDMPAATKPSRSQFQKQPDEIAPERAEKQFRMPGLLSEEARKALQISSATILASNRSDSGSTLSSPDSSIIIMSSQAQSSNPKTDAPREISPSPEPSPETTGSVCPMCRKPVDGDHLYAFSAEHNFRLNVRLQEIFCRQHKEKSAKDAYAAGGYPQIVWHKLEAHMARHTPRLEAVLQGKEKSVYRDKLEQNARTGSNRNLLSAIMTEEFKDSTTGYYGARGARVMMEYITKAFAPQIRKLAPTDKAIASGGMSKFVQSVLLPELVIQLVMDDMKVGKERAKEIIKESGEVGDLVHEEDDDATRRDENGKKYTVLPDDMESEEDSDDYV